MFGAGGGTSSYQEIEETDVIVLWGSNAREAHPIFFHHLLKGVDNGARMFCVDPRRTSSAKFADVWLGLEVGSDIALANAVGREIIDAGLARHRRSSSTRPRASTPTPNRSSPTPSTAAPRLTGVPADAIRELAHAYATAETAQLLWTLGITEHHNAVDNVLGLCNLALLTGHVGRWGSGLVPLRGQNNVQGGGDMGALPNKLPGFADVADPEARARFEAVWGAPVPPDPGLHLTLMFEAMERRELRALYVIGENPADSEADITHARDAALGPRHARRAGHLPHPHRRDGRRRAARLGGLGRVRGHRHVQRAPGAAGAGRGPPAGRGPRRHRHHRRPGRGHGPRGLGPTRPRGAVGRAAVAVAACTRA